MDTRVVTSHLPADLAEKLDGLAERLDRPRGWIVKEAISSYVALEEERRRLTLEALDHQRPRGLGAAARVPRTGQPEGCCTRRAPARGGRKAHSRTPAARPAPARVRGARGAAHPDRGLRNPVRACRARRVRAADLSHARRPLSGWPGLPAATLPSRDE